MLERRNQFATSKQMGCAESKEFQRSNPKSKGGKKGGKTRKTNAPSLPTTRTEAKKYPLSISPNPLTPASSRTTEANHSEESATQLPSNRQPNEDDRRTLKVPSIAAGPRQLHTHRLESLSFVHSIGVDSEAAEQPSAEAMRLAAALIAENDEAHRCTSMLSTTSNMYGPSTGIVLPSLGQQAVVSNPGSASSLPAFRTA